MPANESSLRVYFMGRFNCKFFYVKCVFLQILETITRLLYFFKKVRSARHTVAIENLFYLTPSQPKGKFLYPLKH